MARIRNTKHNILIVCEGVNTERLFFQSIKDRISRKVYDIGDVFIKIRPEEIDNGKEYESKHKPTRKKRSIRESKSTFEEIPGVPPEKWVLAAKEELRTGTFEEVWAVFDHDHHPNRKEAFEQAEERINGQCVQIAFTSICFEYYLLLHFEKIYKSFAKSECREPHNSQYTNPQPYNCGKHIHTEDCYGQNCVIGYMREHSYLPADYSTKGNSSVFELISEKLLIGYIHAAWLRRMSEESESTLPVYDRNPYTNLDALVSRLTTGRVLYYHYLINGDTKSYKNSISVSVVNNRMCIENIGKTILIIPANQCLFIVNGNTYSFGERMQVDPLNSKDIKIPDICLKERGYISFQYEDQVFVFEY